MICGRCSFYWLCASGWGSHQSIQNSKQKLKGATANVQNGPTLNISQYCVVSLCWFCASDWLDQRENSGRVFFYKARKFPVLARTPRRVFCSIPARWSQTSMVLPLLKPSNTWEPCGRRGKPGLVETSKRRVAVCVKMGHTGNKHYTTNLWLIQ